MTIRRDTGAAKVPAIPKVNFSDPALRSWAQAVTEWIEVRSGSRGNTAETAVTRRELDAISGAVQILQEPPTPAPGETLVPIGGGMYASISVEKFAESIRSTRLYRDLMRAIDDPTRFDDYARPIRELLATSIADEAAVRGASVSRVEIEAQTANESIAAIVEEVTAAFGLSTAGIRDTMAAFANETAAQAVAVTQLESSLGNYYQDGTPGRAVLETELSTTASAITGLNAQYTVKVTAGGAMAGFGLAATEVNGTPSSAFIISADKFAIVSPNYSGGLTNNPSVNHVPFGVDAQGIYLNNNVYIKGTTIIDTPQGSRPVASGMRGSLNLSASGTSWSDTTARQSVWSALGNTGSAPNSSHLVIGDTVTIRGTGSPPNFIETRYWGGSSWLTPGGVINGNLLVDGTLSASKINGGTFSGASIQIASSAGGWLLDAGFNGTVVGYRQLNGYNIVAGNLASPSTPAITGETAFSGEGVRGTCASTNSSSSAHGVRGSNQNKSTSGLVGAANGYNFYADGTPTGSFDYGTFTGAHDALIAKSSLPPLDPGDIVVDVQVVASVNMSNQITEVSRSSAPNQKGAVGVFVAPSPVPIDLEPTEDDPEPFLPNALRTLSETELNAVRAAYTYIVMNALGEGQINVCGEGGNLEPGDLIVTSSMPGKGMKQADDIVRNYTVAKCREHVTFSGPTDVKLVACIYLCG